MLDENNYRAEYYKMNRSDGSNEPAYLPEATAQEQQDYDTHLNTHGVDQTMQRYNIPQNLKKYVFLFESSSSHGLLFLCTDGETGPLSSCCVVVVI